MFLNGKGTYEGLISTGKKLAKETVDTNVGEDQ